MILDLPSWFHIQWSTDNSENLGSSNTKGRKHIESEKERESERERKRTKEQNKFAAIQLAYNCTTCFGFIISCVRWNSKSVWMRQNQHSKIQTNNILKNCLNSIIEYIGWWLLAHKTDVIEKKPFTLFILTLNNHQTDTAIQVEKDLFCCIFIWMIFLYWLQFYLFILVFECVYVDCWCTLYLQQQQKPNLFYLSFNASNVHLRWSFIRFRHRTIYVWYLRDRY